MTQSSITSVGSSRETYKLSDGTSESILIRKTNTEIQTILGGDFQDVITDKNVYLSTALYLIYWYHRTKNNQKNHAESLENMREYFGRSYEKQIQKMLKSEKLQNIAKEHVEGGVLVRPTVDICLFSGGNVLTQQRTFFPQGPALVGGFIIDSDFENELQIPASAFAALRVAGEKVLQSENCVYGEEYDDTKGKYYFVRDKSSSQTIKLFYTHLDGYNYKDEVKRMVHASDPRHIVDTQGFALEFDGDIAGKDNLSFTSLDQISNLDNEQGGLAFGHHREIVEDLKENEVYPGIEDVSHHEFVRSMIRSPLDTYKMVKGRFEETTNHAETPFPELLPVVRKLIHDLYSEEINAICDAQSMAHMQRNLIDNDLKHCFSSKDKPCPYQSTIHAIYKAIDFFDCIERVKREFTKDWNSKSFNPQDPRFQQYAYFFRTKYKNHFDDLLAKFPNEILIPSFEHIGATDLIKVRGIPLRFIGLSTKFLYVDEFWQSPIEFFLHDADHSLRMAEEDEKLQKTLGISKDESVKASLEFTQELLPLIKIQKKDSEEAREMKKLKKVIIFEVCHEDSRSLTREILANAIQTEEGRDIHKENLTLDKDGVFYTRKEETITQGGVSPLAFVLHKLQHGFFDQVDNQISQIVHPKYRTAEYIAKAAYELLRDIHGEKNPSAEVDESGNVSYKWLLQRTCSKTVYKTHHTEYRDPSIKAYGDGTEV